MSETVKTRITFVLEHELIAAGKAVRRFYETHVAESRTGFTEDDRNQATTDFINACTAALWHVTGETPIIVTSARELFGGKRGPSRRPPAEVRVENDMTAEQQPKRKD